MEWEVAFVRMMMLPAVVGELGAPTARAAEHFEDRMFYLGDLHVHTGASGDGGATDLGTCSGECGAVAEMVDIAKANGLDFMATTDHVNGAPAATSEDWAKVTKTLEEETGPATGFIGIPGAEVWFEIDGQMVGHKTMLFFGTNRQLAGLSIRDTEPNHSSSDSIPRCERIWTFAAEAASHWGPVLLIPHHPALAGRMDTDWSCHLVPGARIFAPAVEIYSEHGNSEDALFAYDPLWQGTVEDSTVAAALDPDRYGLKLGFIGGTDRHDTHPGAVCAVDTERTEHPYGGGLTVVVLPEGVPFTRQSIYWAIVQRHTYATSGPLVPARIDYSSGGALLGGMGDQVGVAPGQGVEVDLRVPAEWDPLVVEVQLKGAGEYVQDLRRTAVGEWTGQVPPGEIPAYLYADLTVDGAALYGPKGCNDGGLDHDEHLWLSPTWFVEGNADLDRDGWTVSEGDCDDGDPAVNPSRSEICNNRVDDDCDGQMDIADDECTLSGAHEEIATRLEIETGGTAPAGFEHVDPAPPSHGVRRDGGYPRTRCAAVPRPARSGVGPFALALLGVVSLRRRRG